MTGPNLLIDSCAMPDLDGYRDVITVCNGALLYHGAGSACPNPRRPVLAGGAPWWQAYGFVDAQECQYRCVLHKRYGKCLILNDGGRLWARNYNPKHGAWYLEGIFVHSGQTATWRGSAGCPTLPPGDPWERFISCFERDQIGRVVIRDCLEQYRGRRR